jgi:hypothetical protein
VWMSSFVEEPKEDSEGLDCNSKRGFIFPTATLLGLSMVGFMLQVLTAWKAELIFPAVSWALACILIAAVRPTTTPKGLLVLFASIFTTQAILLIDSRTPLSTYDIPTMLSIIIALFAIVIILTMPLRDPSHPTDEISPPFSAPTASLRSPEDNITLWNFMTVSWMTPLISLGNERQLHDEDVWGLGYEFKHRVLHDSFRELKGNVLSRLIQANGVDLCILTVLSVIELSSSKFISHLITSEVLKNIDFSAPVLLQKILQCMANPLAPRRAALNYAILSLVVRLIAAQSGVFTLWYGRRAYERSRGEMITMLYEKTLSRKVVSVSSKPVIEVAIDAEHAVNGHDSHGNGNGHSNGNGMVKHATLHQSKRLFEFLAKSSIWIWRPKKAKVEKKKDFASMGKILNLMR